MPWKNGKGTTRELLIEPEGALFPRDPFLWRLSSAPIRESTVFSQFPGYARLLMVLTGEGLQINGTPLLPLQMLSFSGDEITEAKLASSEVLDLGLIYDPKRVRAAMKSVEIEKKTKLDLSVDPGECLLVLWNKGAGKIKAVGATHPVAEGDLVRIENHAQVSLFGEMASQVICIRVVFLQNSKHGI